MRVGMPKLAVIMTVIGMPKVAVIMRGVLIVIPIMTVCSVCYDDNNNVMVAVTTPMMAMMEGVEMTVTTTSGEGLEMAVTTSMMAVIMRGVIVIPTMTSVLLRAGAEKRVAETTPMGAIV